MKNKKKGLLAFFINLIIVFLEIIGVVLSIKRRGISAFMFYTENVNYFTLIVSALFVLEYLIKQKTSGVTMCLRFTSTVCLCVTFVMVVTVLIPMFPNTFVFMMFKDSNLYQHLICPTLSIVSLILFENKTKFKKIYLLYALMPTFVYGVVCIILNLTKVIIGPYPFFYLYKIPWYISLPWLVGVFLVVCGVDILIFWLHNKKFLRKKIKWY